MPAEIITTRSLVLPNRVQVGDLSVAPGQVVVVDVASRPDGLLLGDVLMGTRRPLSGRVMVGEKDPGDHLAGQAPIARVFVADGTYGTVRVHGLLSASVRAATRTSLLARLFQRPKRGIERRVRILADATALTPVLSARSDQLDPGDELRLEVAMAIASKAKAVVVLGIGEVKGEAEALTLESLRRPAAFFGVGILCVRFGNGT